MNSFDTAIVIACLAAFALGLTGRGLISLSLTLAAGAAGIAAGYLFGPAIAERGWAWNEWVGGLAVFLAVFAAIAALRSVAGKVPGLKVLMRVADGIISAGVVAVAAVFLFEAAEAMRGQEKTEDAAKSLIRGKIIELYDGKEK